MGWLAYNTAGMCRSLHPTMPAFAAVTIRHSRNEADVGMHGLSPLLQGRHCVSTDCDSRQGVRPHLTSCEVRCSTIVCVQGRTALKGNKTDAAHRCCRQVSCDMSPAMAAAVGRLTTSTKRCQVFDSPARICLAILYGDCCCCCIAGRCQCSP